MLNTCCRRIIPFFLVAFVWFLGCDAMTTTEPTAEAPPAPQEATLAKKGLDPIPEQAYVGHIGASFVSVLDVPSMTKVGELPVPAPASGAPDLVMAKNGQFAYIVHTGGGLPGLSKVDLSTNTILGTTTFDSGSSPFDVAITPNGKRVFVTLFFANAVAAVDAQTMGLLAVIALTDDTDFPNGIAMGPGGHHAFVANQGSGRVHVIDTKSLTLVAAIDTGFESVNELALTQNGRFMFVTAFSTSTVVVIDARGFAVANSIPLAHGATGIDIPPSGREAYAVGGGFLSVIDTETLSVVETIDIPGGTARIGVNTNGRLAIVTRRGAGEALLIDLVHRTILATTNLGDSPKGVAFLQGHQR